MQAHKQAKQVSSRAPTDLSSQACRSFCPQCSDYNDGAYVGLYLIATNCSEIWQPHSISYTQSVQHLSIQRNLSKLPYLFNQSNAANISSQHAIRSMKFVNIVHLVYHYTNVLIAAPCSRTFPNRQRLGKVSRCSQAGGVLKMLQLSSCST